MLFSSCILTNVSWFQVGIKIFVTISLKSLLESLHIAASRRMALIIQVKSH